MSVCVVGELYITIFQSLQLKVSEFICCDFYWQWQPCLAVASLVQVVRDDEECICNASCTSFHISFVKIYLFP